MPKTPVTVLSSTTGEVSATGDAIKASGYYGFKDGFHTISVHLSNFIGVIYIDATLAEDPTDDDWFAITLDGQNNAYLQFDTSTTSTTAYTFTGNYVYIRARFDRSNISPTPTDTSNVGLIRKILLNY